MAQQSGNEKECESLRKGQLAKQRREMNKRMKG